MSNATSEDKSARWPQPIVAGGLVIGLFVVSQLAAYVILGLLTSALGRQAGKSLVLFGNEILSQFAYIVLAEGIILGALVAVLRLCHVGWRDLGLVRPRWSDPAFAIVAFGVYISAYLILVAVISPLVPGLDIGQKQDIGFNGASGLVPLTLVFLALVVLAPLTEEILMRGFFYGSLRRRLPFWLATVITSLVFASLHLNGGEQGAGPIWIAAIDTFMLSLALCYLREKTGRLWASIGLHALKNGIAFVALFLLASGS